MSVNLSEAETIKCEHCGNILFIESYVLKRVSGILSGTGKDIIAPLQMFSCGQCGAVQKDLGGTEAAGTQPAVDE